MKRLLIIIGLIFYSLQGYCDTLDYWQVYLNDSVIGKFNAASQDLTIDLDLKTLNESDLLSIRHGDDTPCSTCTFHLLVTDEHHKNLKEAHTNEYWGKMTIPVSDLIEAKKQRKIERFDFYYYERFGDGTLTEKQLILNLRLDLKARPHNNK